MQSEPGAITLASNKHLETEPGKQVFELEQKVINLMLQHSDIIAEMVDAHMGPEFFDQRHRPLVQAIFYTHGVSDGKRLLTDDHYRSLLIEQNGKGDITIAMQVFHECMFGVHFSNTKENFDLLKKQLVDSFVHRKGLEALKNYNKDTPNMGYLQATKKYVKNLDKAIQQTHQQPFDIVCMDDVEEKQIDWLWNMRLPLGMTVIIAGEGGLGKSFVTLDIAAQISNGISFPDTPYEPNNQGHVLFLSAEDLRSETLKPRLRKQGANMKNIHHIRSLKNGDSIVIRDDINMLRRALDQFNYRLLVIDPINAYLPDETKHVSDNEIRKTVMLPLQKLAEDYHVSVIGICHFNKDKSQSAKGRVLGSVGYTNAARMVWNVIPDKTDPNKRLFLGSKNNIVQTQEGLAFKIIEDEEELLKPKKHRIGKLVWEDGVVDITADEALSEDTALSTAAEWLKQKLHNQTMSFTEVSKRAEEEGISVGTLRRAKKEAGVKSSKTPGGWDWYMDTKKVDTITAKGEEYDW